ncbi:hypothetical protein SIN09_37760, partial [Streptomyces sp. F8]|nr:hypothetical protein [Streptomyces sp. F8]
MQTRSAVAPAGRVVGATALVLTAVTALAGAAPRAAATAPATAVSRAGAAAPPVPVLSWGPCTGP